MNTSHDDKTSSTADSAAAADRGEHAPLPETGEQPDMREIRGEEELQGMRQEGDRYEQMRESDSVAADGRTGNQGQHQGDGEQQGEQLAPLFVPQMAQGFQAQWDEVQIGFVDDPAQAVRHADELVAQVMRNLAETFAEERADVESQMDQGDTELMRVALRRYRSFFQRLLSM